MAMTTADSTKISASVVTDVNANLDAPASNGRRVLSREAAILLNKSIVARPLMTPEVCSIRVKNTEYAYRWVNKLASHGQMYQMRRAQGFINATTDDVEVLGGDASSDKGEITSGDLILMKIRADIYDAALKWNMEKALIMQRTRGVYLKDNGASDMASDATPQRASVSNEAFARTGKATPFIPENPDALIDDSIKSGRVEAARNAVKEFRAEKGAKGA